MSDTPKTGALLESILRRDRFLSDKNAPEEWVVHARQLERELVAAQARIQRLVEAGDMLDNSVACGCGVDGPCRRCSKAIENWTSAKEEKA